MTIRYGESGKDTLPINTTEGFPWKITAPPPTVGYYVLGDLWFGLTYKPFWLHRLGVRLVLGWNWQDT